MNKAKCALIALATTVACAVVAPAALGATVHYCSPCSLSYQSEYEGPVRHSYTLNYGHVVSSGSGWVSVRAHDSGHSPYGSAIQAWDTATHSYSGSNLLYMIVGNIYYGGYGNGKTVSDNAHGNY